MFKSIQQMAGVFVLLLAVVVLVAVVVNSSVSAKDIKEGAEELARKASEAEITDILRERITAEPAPKPDKPTAAPEVGALDPVARALSEKPKPEAAKAADPDIDLIDQLLDEAQQDAAEARPAEPEKPKVPELTRPSRVAPAKARPKPVEELPARAVKSPSAPASTPAVRPGDTYVIRRGDTLYRIALDVYGDGKMWKAIARANGIRNPSRISVGTKLKLPAQRLAAAR